MSSSTSDPRVARLSKYFNEVLSGKRVLGSSRDGKLFLEALCTQNDRASCIYRVQRSKAGLSSLQASMRFDTSSTFINQNALELLRYLQDPSLKTIDSGSVLGQILLSMVEPPFFLDAFTKALTESLVNADALHAYAWLLLQLLSLPGNLSSLYVSLAKSGNILDLILNASDGHTRNLGQKIKHYLPLDPSELHIDAEAKPGGRHDNDFANHRQISIMPTSDELLSRERPFMRTTEYLENPDLASSRHVTHLDNQFRLLREDMLVEIREELQILTGAKSGRHKGVTLSDVRIADLNTGVERKRVPWGIVLAIPDGLPHLKNIRQDKRQGWLRNNKHILKHESMACLLVDNEPLAFPFLHRDDGELAKIPGKITVQFRNDPTMKSALLKMRTAENMKLVQLDSAIFAYEPFLQRLQEIRELPLAPELLHWEEDTPLSPPSFQPSKAVLRLEHQTGKDLKDILKTKESIVLDKSQHASLCACLSQRVSLVQGPPGTGKSFIGALAAKTLHMYTNQVILVVCFTNHALDQFLEDLLKIGIPPSHMVRLGGRSTDLTKPLTMREQTSVKLDASQWADINKLEQKLRDDESRLGDAFGRFRTVNVSKRHLMEYLEFLSDELPFFDAFTVPSEDDEGTVTIGRGGRRIDEFYLLDRWSRGMLDAGTLTHLQPQGTAAVWSIPREARDSYITRWQNDILTDLVIEIQDAGQQYNRHEQDIRRIRGERDAAIIKTKRIIACTTNGASKYFAAIQAASPGVVLVEEAGEILEAQILTSLGPSTEQLLLIGDHKQLRPKCSYELSVTKSDGFDLNRSLFERLVLKGFPHTTLNHQHRMRPEISDMIRQFTYPDLTDAASTFQRPDLRGFRDNVIFVNHNHSEIELKRATELRDGKTSTKQNTFEAQMVLKCIRYLAQQGYGAAKMVVLTPYMGQLKLLRDELAEHNDPVLNDLDKFDLIRAGLLTDLGSKEAKPSLRISTIDNYQGEESDIVVVSLTRCNDRHDIGFLVEPERLNVLLSRARDALILIGSATTFINSHKGGEVWKKFFKHLTEHNHIYNGFPVKCEKHPSRIGLLSSPDDFEIHCPDGGCREPCGVLLACGVHKCPFSCHQLVDHSKMKCAAVLKQQCPNGHSQFWKCHQTAPETCHKCEQEKKQAEKKANKALQDKLNQEEQTRQHLAKLAQIDQEIEQIAQSMRTAQIESQHQAILAQKLKDLETAKERAKQPVTHALPHPQPANNTIKSKTKDVSAHPKSSAPSKTKTESVGVLKQHIQDCVNHNQSSSKTEWQRQKDQENANNPAIDGIMEMIGLEDVKSQVLKIKAKVETSTRQGTDLKKDRFGLVLLGNPGTGKTTVARHYARVLTSLKVLSGDGFIETTGSRLAHGGVAEVKDHFKNLQNSNGGVYFIDEAYQLAEGHNYGGKQVLDFLLAEIENLTGQVVFVFAGYRKQMEKFFEHNPGFASRVPYKLNFEDYTDPELLKMLQFQMVKFYQGMMKVEDSLDGLYMRISVRRLGRGRGRDGFGNGRALENIFARIRERQSDRLTRERREGRSPSDYLITKEDLIGPDPSKAILTCNAWTQLQKLTGLKSVKDSVRFLIDLIKTNYERELQEKPLIEVSLNRVFLGAPGTGKTTVAKLYGQILADIGLLSSGEVVVKNPADFIGSALGQSETNTKGILATSIGKVLVIDEAYMLYSGSNSGSGGGGTDIYKTAVIDTIVAEIQSVPGEDRCVLLLGYEPQMIEMFQNVNPGLTRRFPLADAFHFEDFSDSELQEILNFKLSSQGLGATSKAVSVAIDVLARARNGLNFGNGGDVENLISKAKANYQARQSNLPVDKRSIDFTFAPEDFDPDYLRASSAATNLGDLFQGVIGSEEIVRKLQGFLKVASGMRAQGLDPRGQIPMNFIFKGPPGTGKTTTARKFGKVYYDLGFLSHVEVVECSASDLIGQYVGQTGPRTIKQLERGLGKVLFIDEAYRLGEGHFAQEAVNELVDIVTKPRFAGKLVIILAGYSNDMDNLLRVNEGLSSRFADQIIFPPLGPEDCLRLLDARLKESRVLIPELQDSTKNQELLSTMAKLSQLPSWGNARDVQTLAKEMVRLAYQTNQEKVDQLTISGQAALQCIQKMLSEREARNKTPLSSTPTSQVPVQQFCPSPPKPPVSLATSTTSASEVKHAANSAPSPVSNAAEEDAEEGDAGVSDSIWHQLQKDKEMERARAARDEQEIKAKEEMLRRLEEEEKQAKAALTAMLEAEAKREETSRLLKEREQARIREAEAKARKELARRELERMRQLAEEKRKKEQQVQTKLRQMGVCVMGFRWIKQTSGYRCAGGSHFVSNGQLGM